MYKTLTDKNKSHSKIHKFRQRDKQTDRITGVQTDTHRLTDGQTYGKTD